MHDASVHLRSYRGNPPDESHPFVQIVLPVAGTFEIDVGGRQSALSRSTGTLIYRQTSHELSSSGFNRSLILDIDERTISAQLLDKFSSSPFFEIGQRTAMLSRHMSDVLQKGEQYETSGNVWAPILIESLADGKTDTLTRLCSLRAMIEIDPFMPWSIERMADHVGVSLSRLQTVFRDQFDETPHLWLANLRMEKICRLLSNSPLPIAEIADRAGFSDQTALTRAMKNAMGTTPAAYRRAFSQPPQ